MSVTWRTDLLPPYKRKNRPIAWEQSGKGGPRPQRALFARGTFTRTEEISRPVGWSSILLAADLSATASRALRVAVELARLYSARLAAVHVPSLGASRGRLSAGRKKGSPVGEGFSKEGRRRLEERFSALSHELILGGGESVQALSGLIEKRKPGVLVLEAASPGRKTGAGTARSHQKNIAQEIFRRAPCAIMTVKPSAATEQEEAAPHFERILYATDFSVESLAAAPSAVSLASRAEAQLTLLHASDERQPEEASAALETLRDLVPLGTRLFRKPRCLVERGALAELCLRLASAENSSLLVLGIAREEAGTYLGPRQTVAEAWDIAMRASCPVLTVRS